MTQDIAGLSKLARRHPLNPAVLVAAIVIVAATAKLGYGMWGIGGLFAFYPAYLAVLIVRDSAVLALSRLIVPPLATRRAYARVRVRR